LRENKPELKPERITKKLVISPVWLVSNDTLAIYKIKSRSRASGEVALVKFDTLAIYKIKSRSRASGEVALVKFRAWKRSELIIWNLIFDLLWRKFCDLSACPSGRRADSW